LVQKWETAISPKITSENPKYSRNVAIGRIQLAETLNWPSGFLADLEKTKVSYKKYKDDENNRDDTGEAKIKEIKNFLRRYDQAK